MKFADITHAGDAKPHFIHVTYMKYGSGQFFNSIALAKFPPLQRGMALPPPALPRVSVDGKFFRVGEEKVFLKGVTYGPFAPSTEHETFAAPEQTARDLAQIRELGANLLRIYHVPPKWLLDLALQHELRVLVDVPWPKDVCFLESKSSQRAARQAVRNAVQACERHSAVFAFSVANEIPPDIVRWSGAKAVGRFVDELVEEARNVHADTLCTFGSYPPTEFLHSTNIDFVCFNVYLHHQKSFENYLARLQMVANFKPLLLGELGIDSMREGEDAKSKMLAWQIESAFRGGVAGTIVFSFTDDWHRGGHPSRSEEDT